MSDRPRRPSPSEGDRVIGRALKISLFFAMAGVVLVAAALWVLRTQTGGDVLVGDSSPTPAQPAVEETRASRPRFVDVTEAAGIDAPHASGAAGESLLPETMGGGVAFFDADSDGDPDLLLVNGGTLPGVAPASTAPALTLYLNDGTGAFAAMAPEASGLIGSFYGMGVATGDYDGDGRIDVYVTAVGPNRLYRSLGEGRFEEVTATAQVTGAEDAWSSSAVFVDIDRDNDLDLFVVNYVAWSREIDFEVDYRLAGIGRAYGPPTNYPGSASYLFRNEGDGSFTDVSEEAGVVVRNPATDAPSGKGLAVLAMDVNEDGWVDLLVANDTVGNYLLLGDGDGTFTEVGTTAGLAFDNTGTATGAMGMDVAWYDDGQTLGVAVGNFANEMSSYYVTELAAAAAGSAEVHPVPVFTDEAAISGIGAPSRRALTFGLLFFDYDLDGHQDLLQVNGHVEDEINVVQPSQQYAQAAQLFWRCAASDCARPFVALETADLGALAQPRVGRGAAHADIDGDGDLDLLLTAIDDRPLLLRNDTPGPDEHWLRVRLRDEREGSQNRFGLGATVTVVLEDGSLRRRLLSPARSYLSQVETVASFGLGTAAIVKSVQVRWPDGKEQRIGPLAVDGVWEIRRGDSAPTRYPSTAAEAESATP
ncbi:MAG: CRTAC1 family protein [Pseudomonadota bacterium]